MTGVQTCALPISVTQPKIAGLPFYFAAFIAFITYVHTRRMLAGMSREELKGVDEVVRLEESSGLLSGRVMKSSHFYSYESNSTSCYNAEELEQEHNPMKTADVAVAVACVTVIAGDGRLKYSDVPVTSCDIDIESLRSPDSHHENENQVGNTSHAESTLSPAI